MFNKLKNKKKLIENWLEFCKYYNFSRLNWDLALTSFTIYNIQARFSVLTINNKTDSLLHTYQKFDTFATLTSLAKAIKKDKKILRHTKIKVLEQEKLYPFLLSVGKRIFDEFFVFSTVLVSDLFALLCPFYFFEEVFISRNNTCERQRFFCDWRKKH